MESNNINPHIFISKNISEKMRFLEQTEFMKICKVIGILMDNALEASKKSNNKKIIMDVYNEGKYIVFYIENTFSNNIDIKKLNNKGYTTKSKESGWGLFIANKVIRESNRMSLEQKIIDKSFISIFKYKYF